jgi:hypothetical protein
MKSLNLIAKILCAFSLEKSIMNLDNITTDNRGKKTSLNFISFKRINRLIFYQIIESKHLFSLFSLIFYFKYMAGLINSSNKSNT